MALGYYIKKGLTEAEWTAQTTELRTIPKGVEVDVLDGSDNLLYSVTGDGVTDILSLPRTYSGVFDADDIDDSSTINKFVTSAEKTKLSNLSGVNTGDQNLSGLASNQIYTGTISGNNYIVADNFTVRPLHLVFKPTATNPTSTPQISITLNGVPTLYNLVNQFGGPIIVQRFIVDKAYNLLWNSANSTYEAVGVGVAKRVVSEVVTNGLTLSGNKEAYELTYNSATAGTITFVATNLPNIDDRCITRCDGVGRLTIVAPAGYTIPDPDALNGNVRNMVIIRSGATTLRIK